MFEPETLTKLVKIIFADLLLAGDNALIIALATRSLPRKQQFFGRIFGAGGAVVLRVIFVILISHLLAVPFLQLAGGLALLWIAAKLVRPQEEAVHEAAEGGSTETKAAKAVTLRAAVGMIIVADITMSFDNVVAIANIAADPITRKLHTGLVIFGLLFSIPLVVWGSQLDYLAGWRRARPCGGDDHIPGQESDAVDGAAGACGWSGFSTGPDTFAGQSGGGGYD